MATALFTTTDEIINIYKTASEHKKFIAELEETIFPKFKVYYCSFLKWHPREPIKYEDIMEDAKFVLDKEALNSWSQKDNSFF
jgi:hypothetical protein